MALVFCPECEHEVTAAAGRCPKCGSALPGRSDGDSARTGLFVLPRGLFVVPAGRFRGIIAAWTWVEKLCAAGFLLILFSLFQTWYTVTSGEDTLTRTGLEMARPIGVFVAIGALPTIAYVCGIRFPFQTFLMPMGLAVATFILLTQIANVAPEQLALDTQQSRSAAGEAGRQVRVDLGHGIYTCLAGALAMLAALNVGVFRGWGARDAE